MQGCMAYIYRLSNQLCNIYIKNRLYFPVWCVSSVEERLTSSGSVDRNHYVLYKCVSSEEEHRSVSEGRWVETITYYTSALAQWESARLITWRSVVQIHHVLHKCVSSAVECQAHNLEVGGSNPSRTIFFALQKPVYSYG